MSPRKFRFGVPASPGASERYHDLVAGIARYPVPARVQRAERMLEGVRIAVPIAPLNAARKAQRAITTRWWCPDVPSFGGPGAAASRNASCERLRSRIDEHAA
jgi:hypothetical protein